MKTFITQHISSQSICQSVVSGKWLSLTGIISLGILSSCASDPVPEVVYPIPNPVSFPTPALENEDVTPDPVDIADSSSSENAASTADAHISGVIRIAKPVPGRPGFVFNPYNQNMVNVEGIPSGTKVKDPHDSDQSHVFKVP